MKTIILKKEIINEKAKCNWCGLEKDCFKSDDIKKHFSQLKDNFVLDWFNKKNTDNLSFWGNEYKTGKQELYWATEQKNYEVVDVFYNAHICKDCINSLK